MITLVVKLLTETVQPVIGDSGRRDVDNPLGDSETDRTQ